MNLFQLKELKPCDIAKTMWCGALHYVKINYIHEPFVNLDIKVGSLTLIDQYRTYLEVFLINCPEYLKQS